MLDARFEMITMRRGESDGDTVVDYAEELSTSQQTLGLTYGID
jgi:hypothetical protein